MAKKPTSDQPVNFKIKGLVQLENKEKLPQGVELAAYIYTNTGQLLGEGTVNKKGDIDASFSIPGISERITVELMIGPKGDPKSIRKSSAHKQIIHADDWQQEGDQLIYKPDINISDIVWSPWLPKHICVSGHVRKIMEEEDTFEICPVPFVKVEVFDVDREFCWWPYIRRWWDILLDKRVARIPELLKEREIEVKPFPGPDPVPDFSRLSRSSLGKLETIAINPQPEPPAQLYNVASLSPQPEPPDLPQTYVNQSLVQKSFERVGETRLIDASIAAKFDNLTLTSKLAPWLVFPWCFYSKQKVCETTTDESGYFRCCFDWWTFHFRHGRLRFDSKPDIIIKVTQIIDGVERVLYLDPYTSTRWNITNAHIDLWLDDEEIICGSGDEQTRPPGSQTFFTRIGDDEVYQINQTTGLYNDTTDTNVAYGHLLHVYAQFGNALSDGGVLPGKFYRLSFAKYGSPPSAFKPLILSLNDTRVNKITNFSETYHLGPHTVNGTAGLYEIRDTLHYLWYNPDLIGLWQSWLAENDTGKYILRLEIFDKDGNKVGSPAVDYLDGTHPPNGVLPPMTDQADLIITLDNKAPKLELDTSAINDCGVIPWSSIPPLNLFVKASQENNRLRHWQLQYTKGVEPPPPHLIARATSHSGSLGVVNQTIDATNYPNPYTPPPTHLNMLDGVTGTCAFALKLWARPHIRNGRHFIYYREIIKAIAIERCE